MGQIRFRLGIAALLAFAVLRFASPAMAADGSLDVPVKANEAADAPVTEKLHLYSTSKALVIGNDNYGGAGWFKTNDGWPKLSKGIEDAEAVAKSLEAKGFKVTFLKDLGSDALKNALEDFFIREGADPESRLLIWYAGHGHTINGEGYLVPVDAPNPNKDEIEFRRKALSLRRFGEFMRGANAKHVLAVFDSCFAGTIFDVARALPPRAITRATGLKVRQFISSGDANQVVSDNGRFRRLFIDALDGKEPTADPNGDGFITGTELGLFLSDKITNLSEKGQTPRYGKLIAEGYDRGDFVLEKGAIELPKVATVPEAPAPQQPALGSATRSSAAEAQAAWAMAKQSTSITSIEAFRQQFGKENPFYDQVATERIAALKDETAKKETAERAAKETAERNERENAAAEEQRKAEDAKAAAEAKRKAEETRVAMLVKEDEARIAKETAEADAATEALRKSNEAAAAEAKRRVDAVEQMRRDVLALEDARKHDVSVADAKRKADQAKSETERLQLSMLAKEDEERKSKEAAEATKPGRVFRDCEDKDSAGHYICPEMVVVPAGEFLMGSPENEEGHDDNEGPQHTVKIAKPFAVGKLEITFAEWDACSDCRYQPKDEGWGRGNRPVINVSWDDAKQYVGWLATKTGKPYRLLSEAEWEYAARAGTTTPFSFGGTITPEQANFIGNYTYGGSAKGEYRLKTILAGSFKPNAFGLHDMHGNVWEWVEDCYKDSYQSASTDGSTVPVVASCFFRVLRGGSWYNYPRDLRAAYRYMSTPVDRISHLGFRVARSLD